MSAPPPAKPYPVILCTTEEAEMNRQFMIIRQSAEATLAQTVDAAMQKNITVLCGLNTQSSVFWKNIVAKYNLDPNKPYGIRFIEGKPYVCEIKTGEPRP